MKITIEERKTLVTALQGLLAIARIAMPDTYFATDRRVKRAQVLLGKLKK